MCLGIKVILLLLYWGIQGNLALERGKEGSTRVLGLGAAAGSLGVYALSQYYKSGNPNLPASQVCPHFSDEHRHPEPFLFRATGLNELAETGAAKNPPFPS